MEMRRLLFRCFAVVLVVASFGPAGRAQVTTATVRGTVQNSTETNIAGAKIEVRNIDTGQARPTTADFLDVIAHAQEAHRKATIDAITTRQAAEVRQRFVRMTLLAMMGVSPLSAEA